VTAITPRCSPSLPGNSGDSAWSACGGPAENWGDTDQQPACYILAGAYPMKKTFAQFFLLLGLAGALIAATTPNFTGTWKYDPAKSTGGKGLPADTVLVIHQYGDRVEMKYRAGDKDLSSGAYIADGQPRKTYHAKTEDAFVRVKWQNDDLVVTTNHVIMSEIGDVAPVTDTERWSLANNGQTLVRKSSDGKVIEFEKMPEPNKPAPNKAAQPAPAK
jgi:hypothetical protein